MMDNPMTTRMSGWNFALYRRQQLFLQRQIANRTVSQAYLWLGAASEAGRIIANLFIDAILCETANEAPCLRCKQCQQRLAGANHDIIEVAPVGDVGIGIEQIREATRSMYRQPVCGPRRVILIVEANKLTRPAANSLLKVLEEPDGAATMILLCDNRSSLPATIASRCQLVVFNDALAATKAIEDQEYMKLTVKLSDALARKSDEQWPLINAMIADDTTSALLPAVIEGLLRSCLLSKVANERLTNAALQVPLGGVSARYSAERLALSLQALQRVKQDLINYINPQLVWENFFLKLNTL